MRVAVVELGHTRAAGDEDVVAREVERDVVNLRGTISCERRALQTRRNAARGTHLIAAAGLPGSKRLHAAVHAAEVEQLAVVVVAAGDESSARRID